MTDRAGLCHRHEKTVTAKALLPTKSGRWFAAAKSHTFNNSASARISATWLPAPADCKSAATSEVILEDFFAMKPFYQVRPPDAGPVRSASVAAFFPILQFTFGLV
jgi:hypothetical protein